MAIPPPSAVPLQPREEWITPAEQVARLTSPFISKQLHQEGNKQKLESMAKDLPDRMIESVVQSSLKRLTLTHPEAEAKEKLSSLFDLCVQSLFQIDWNTAKREYGNVPFESTHWVLHTNDILENSRYKSDNEQIRLVNSLAKESLVTEHVLNLRDTIATTFLKKIATGGSLYQEGNKKNRGRHTLTHVHEKTAHHRLLVGKFGPTGLVVYNGYFFGPQFIGMGALLKP